MESFLNKVMYDIFRQRDKLLYKYIMPKYLIVSVDVYLKMKSDRDFLNYVSSGIDKDKIFDLEIIIRKGEEKNYLEVVGS